MARGDGPSQIKPLKASEVARVKRQGEALRSNLRKRKDQERARALRGEDTPIADEGCSS